MSLINEYRQTEEAIKELQERLKSLQEDDKLQRELEFEKKLRALMGEYQKSCVTSSAFSIPKPSPLARPVRPRPAVAVRPSAPAKLSNTRIRTMAK